MKKLLVASLFCAAIIALSCGKKTVPSGSSANPDKSEPVKTETVKNDAKTQADIEAKQKMEASEKTTTNTPPSTPVMSALDQGKSIYTTKCNRCHAAKNAGNYTFGQWQGILRSMVPKANLNAEEESQVTAYVKANAKQ